MEAILTGNSQSNLTDILPGLTYRGTFSLYKSSTESTNGGYGNYSNIPIDSFTYGNIGAIVLWKNISVTITRLDTRCPVYYALYPTLYYEGNNRYILGNLLGTVTASSYINTAATGIIPSAASCHTAEIKPLLTLNSAGSGGSIKMVVSGSCQIWEFA